MFVPVPVYLKNPAVAPNVGNATPRNPVVVNVGVIAVVPDAEPEMSPAAVHVIDWFAVKNVGVKYSNADAPAFTRINWFAVPNADNPVPPRPMANVPDQPNVNDAARNNAVAGVPPNVIVTLVSLVAVNAAPVMSAPAMDDQTGIADVVPVPVCDKYCFAVVMFPTKRIGAVAPFE